MLRRLYREGASERSHQADQHSLLVLEWDFEWCQSTCAQNDATWQQLQFLVVIPAHPEKCKANSFHTFCENCRTADKWQQILSLEARVCIAANSVKGSLQNRSVHHKYGKRKTTGICSPCPCCTSALCAANWAKMLLNAFKFKFIHALHCHEERKGWNH